MNILITGGAGFIGSSLFDQLVARGDNVYVVDNLSTGRRENLPSDEEMVNGKGLLWTSSICHSEIMKSQFAIAEPDVVIHAAASYKDPDNWSNDALVNAVGTANVLHMCKEFDVKRLVYFQTSLCYGPDPIEQPITLDHPIIPANNSYAITKTTGEQLIRMSGVNYISFRLANCYGPRNLSGPIPTFYHRLTNDKGCFVVNTRRDFIFIEDLVKIVMKAIDGCGEKGEYHIATGRDYSIAELFEAVTEALEIDAEAEQLERGADDVETILLDPSKTTKHFEVLPRTPLKEGVKKAIEWYRANEIKETYTHLRKK
jgi:UDP-glucose 4-epimerase